MRDENQILIKIISYKISWAKKNRSELNFFVKNSINLVGFD